MDREVLFFPVQLTTCRIGNLTRLIHTLAIYVTIHGCDPGRLSDDSSLALYQTLSIECPLLLSFFVFGNLEGAVRRGRGGKEKEWTGCVQSDIRAFGIIAGDWKATALKAEVWVETVTEDGRRFMAAWKKEQVDAARNRQEKREATRLGNLLLQTGVKNFAKPHPLA